LKSIEDQIRDKKAELKAKSRELSALQNELKKKNEKQWYKVISRYEQPEYDNCAVYVVSNGPIDTEKLRAAIESLSETSEPKSYVDWKDKRLDGYDYIGRNALGDFYMAKEPLFHNNDGLLVSGEDNGFIKGFDRVPNNVLQELHYWRKSLIHRPGAKE